MIKYSTKIINLKPEQLNGFFVNWPNPPSPIKHLEILKNSYKCILAMDGNRVIGFVNAISDGVLSVYIPLLEVLPTYQNRGIGKNLMELILVELKDYYMIDLACDEDKIKFYEKLGMQKFTAMGIRNYNRQNGEKYEK